MRISAKLKCLRFQYQIACTHVRCPSTSLSGDVNMMTSSNGNIFPVTGPLWGESTGRRWIPHHKGQWRGALMLSLINAWRNGWANNRDAGDLKRHRTNYDVIVKYLILSGPAYRDRDYWFWLPWMFMVVYWCGQYRDVKWASWRFKSPATRLSLHRLVQTFNRENVKAPNCCPFVRRIHRLPVDSPHKGQ